MSPGQPVPAASESSARRYRPFTMSTAKMSVSPAGEMSPLRSPPGSLKMPSGSSAQVAEQPSPPMVLPSSHCSPADVSRMELPQPVGTSVTVSS